MKKIKKSTVMPPVGTSAELENLLSLPLMTIAQERKASAVELFERTTRGALMLAKPYLRSRPDLSEEILAAALRGLWEAAQKYDARRFKARFLTFSAWHIRRTIHELLNESVIYIPLYARNAACTINRGEAVTDAHRKAAESIPRVASLDATCGNDDEGTTLYQFTSDNAELPSRLADLADLRGEISEILSDLPPNWSFILTKRMGLDGQKALSLEQLGKKLKLSRERIRQIEFLALREIRKKLKHREISAKDIALMS